MKKLRNIIPFMGGEELKELALKIINGEIEGVKLMIVLPFIRREDLDEIVNLLIEKNQGKDLTFALPFVSQETLAKIQEAAKSGKLEGFNETRLFPFLGKDKLKEMFDEIVLEAANSEDDTDDEDYDDLDDDDLDDDEEDEE